jgi:hypothetical protein
MSVPVNEFMAGVSTRFGVSVLGSYRALSDTRREGHLCFRVWLFLPY